MNFGQENLIKKHESRENPKTQKNTYNPLKISIVNLMWSYRVVTDLTSMVDHVWPNIDQFWQNFANFDYTFLTIRLSDYCHTSLTPISHNILPIQWFDFGFNSRALWTCVVVPTHQEILIGHVLQIQPFAWAQNSSQPIFYPTLSIQWSNFKSNYNIRWTHVVFAYNEISINKNI